MRPAFKPLSDFFPQLGVPQHPPARSPATTKAALAPPHRLPLVPKAPTPLMGPNAAASMQTLAPARHAEHPKVPEFNPVRAMVEDTSDFIDVIDVDLDSSSTSVAAASRPSQQQPLQRAPVQVPAKTAWGLSQTAPKYAAPAAPQPVNQRGGALSSIESESRRPSPPCDVPASGDGALPTRELARHALRTVFGHEGFRGVQEDAIVAAVDGRDAFVVMPTGGGKSLVYCLPAILRPGVTLVVSPLLSLIQDQIVGFVSGSASRLGVSIPAACLSSEQGEAEARAVLRELRKVPGATGQGSGPSMKLLFVTPERVAASAALCSVLDALYTTYYPGTKHRMLARIVVDEAHCVSVWGHEFRPDYIRLKALRLSYPEVPILALTATATERVRLDVISALGMREPAVFVQDFNRPNLVFTVRPKPKGREAAYEAVLKYINEEHAATATAAPASAAAGRPAVARRDGGGTDWAAAGSGIIYCLSRADTEDLADWLTARGVSADFYHAGMPTLQRVLVQNAWQRGDTRVVVATIAYGMGIDHPHVRFVVHFTLAKSLEGYYQEAGRAGRDGKPAHCLILYSPADVVRNERLIRMPAKGRGGKRSAGLLAQSVEKLYEMADFCEAGNAIPPRASSAGPANAGAIATSHLSPSTSLCLRQRLVTYFGQTRVGDCVGTCSNCAAAAPLRASAAAADSRSFDITSQIKLWLRRADPASGIELVSTRAAANAAAGVRAAAGRPRKRKRATAGDAIDDDMASEIDAGERGAVAVRPLSSGEATAVRSGFSIGAAPTVAAVGGWVSRGSATAMHARAPARGRRAAANDDGRAPRPGAHRRWGRGRWKKRKS